MKRVRKFALTRNSLHEWPTSVAGLEITILPAERTRKLDLLVSIFFHIYVTVFQRILEDRGVKIRNLQRHTNVLCISHAVTLKAGVYILACIKAKKAGYDENELNLDCKKENILA